MNSPNVVPVRPVREQPNTRPTSIYSCVHKSKWIFETHLFGNVRKSARSTSILSASPSCAQVREHFHVHMYRRREGHRDVLQVAKRREDDTSTDDQSFLFLASTVSLCVVMKSIQQRNVDSCSLSDGPSSVGYYFERLQG